jgi:hypothetical protein
VSVTNASLRAPFGAATKVGWSKCARPWRRTGARRFAAGSPVWPAPLAVTVANALEAPRTAAAASALRDLPVTRDMMPPMLAG